MKDRQRSMSSPAQSHLSSGGARMYSGFPKVNADTKDTTCPAAESEGKHCKKVFYGLYPCDVQLLCSPTANEECMQSYYWHTEEILSRGRPPYKLVSTRKPVEGQLPDGFGSSCKVFSYRRGASSGTPTAHTVLPETILGLY